MIFTDHLQQICLPILHLLSLASDDLVKEYYSLEFIGFIILRKHGSFIILVKFFLN